LHFCSKKQPIDNCHVITNLIAGNGEVFSSTVEQDDYLMGELQQKLGQNGLLKGIIFGWNELPFSPIIPKSSG